MKENQESNYEENSAFYEEQPDNTPNKYRTRFFLLVAAVIGLGFCGIYRAGFKKGEKDAEELVSAVRTEFFKEMLYEEPPRGLRKEIYLHGTIERVDGNLIVKLDSQGPYREYLDPQDPPIIRIDSCIDPHPASIALKEQITKIPGKAAFVTVKAHGQVFKYDVEVVPAYAGEYEGRWSSEAYLVEN